MEELIHYNSKNKLEQLEYLDFLLSEKEYSKIKVYSTYEDEDGVLRQRILTARHKINDQQMA